MQIKSLDEVINRLQYKADNIKAKLESSYFTECVEYLKSNVSEKLTSSNDGWIPVEERYPDTDKYILLSLSNFSIPIVGRWEEDEDGGAFYAGDEDETLVSQDLFVNAWMPLVKPYRSNEEEAARTNGDRIRSMSNEELTQHILCPYDTAGEPSDIMPCITGDGIQELVPPEACYKCMMEWLERIV